MINAGVPGTGPGNHALNYAEFVAPFRPQLVIVGIFVNDVADDLASPMFRAGPDGSLHPVPPDIRRQRAAETERIRNVADRVPGYSFLAQHSHLVAHVRKAGTRALAGGDSGAVASDWPAFQRRFDREGLPLLRAAIESLSASVRGSGAELVIVMLPPREAIYADQGAYAEMMRWTTHRMRIELSRLAAERGAMLIDVTEPLRRGAASGERLYYHGFDIHPRPAGYAAIGREIAARLEPVIARMARQPGRQGATGRGLGD